MTDDERLAFATGAATHRWEDVTKAPVSPALLLNPRRYGDDFTDITPKKCRTNYNRGITILDLACCPKGISFFALAIEDEQMELCYLHYFLAVAEELNFSLAAERLHVSLPPLSRRIRGLEAELNVKLLDRNTQRVRLTRAGHAVLARARKLVRDAASHGLMILGIFAARDVRNVVVAR